MSRKRCRGCVPPCCAGNLEIMIWGGCSAARRLRAVSHLGHTLVLASTRGADIARVRLIEGRSHGVSCAHSHRGSCSSHQGRAR